MNNLLTPLSMSIKITYTATLTEQEVEILAQVKGYSPTVLESQEQED